MAYALKILAIGALAPLIAVAQERPVAPDPKATNTPDTVVVTGPHTDIDLSGPKPMLHGGLWSFHRGQSVGKLAAGRPFTISACLPDDDLEATLRRVAGERSNMPRTNMCEALHLAVNKGRITGSRSCIRVSRQIGVSHSDLNLNVSGRYDTRSLNITMNMDELTDGFYEGMKSPPRPNWGSWRITATRVGDCPASQGMGQRKLDDATNLLFEPTVSDIDIDGI